MLPSIDAANIAYNLLKTAAGGGVAIGPILLGAAKPVHPDPVGDGAPHRQHDRADRGRRQRGTLNPARHGPRRPADGRLPPGPLGR